MLARKEIVVERGANAANMQWACWAGRKAYPYWCLNHDKKCFDGKGNEKKWYIPYLYI